MSSKRIYLSPPDVGPRERELLLDAYDSNWIAPLGPHVDAFEREFSAGVGLSHAAALSSGTAALHLALLILGVGAGDDVLVSNFTFAATVNAIRYVGARPVLVDSERTSWNIDPALLEDALRTLERQNRRPRAAVIVDLYGQCAAWDELDIVCRAHEIPVIEDAAEALGATYRDKPAGSFGAMSAFSFNGNKIITTSGGGMLCSNRKDWVDRARHLSTQAREPCLHYEHKDIGYNYRLSNLLAAVGRGQLESLAARVDKRRAIRERYRAELGALPGVELMPEVPGGRSTFWLTCILVDPSVAGFSRDDLQAEMAKDDIEARPVWKPMHLQPVFRELECFGGAVSSDLFERGLCLPSGSSMTDADLERVLAAARRVASRVRAA